MDRIQIGDCSEALIGRGFPEPVLPDRRPRTQAVVFVQPSVRYVAERLREAIQKEVSVETVEVPDRDEAKTWEVAGEMYKRLAELNLGRHDTIIGVGGGAVTDLAGFLAATWLRGVESVMVPTTLLGAVDASIGGKTGINLAGKNLVGAFWHPARILVDLDILDGLPLDLKIEGTAELFKAGVIVDRKILDAYSEFGLDAPLDVVVPAAIRVKADVVTADFREAGRRAILNFGHTIGHGVEIEGHLPHGHAVAIGMVAAGAVSCKRYGFDSNELKRLISRLGLPVECPGLSKERVLELISRDKKRISERVRMVLMRDWCDPVVEPVSEEEIELGLVSVGVV